MRAFWMGFSMISAKSRKVAAPINIVEMRSFFALIQMIQMITGMTIKRIQPSVMSAIFAAEMLSNSYISITILSGIDFLYIYLMRVNKRNHTYDEHQYCYYK